MNRFVLLAQKINPRCLDRYVATPRSAMPPTWANDDVSFVASFDISCRCGNATLQVTGIPDEELGLYSPIGTHCTVCGSRELLFDVLKHGHDVELGELSGYEASNGEVQPLSCSSCANTEFTMLPWFTYQFEPNDLADIAETTISNYFDGFGIDMICAKCKAVNYVGQYECA